MPHSPDPLARARSTAEEWLAVIADRLETPDHSFAYRVLRAWLHLVRDRLSVDAAAHLAAQLPELLRGVYYEGWTPSRVPVAHDAESFRRSFADEASVGASDVPPLAGAVFDGLDTLFSPGQLDHVLAAFPVALRAELEGRPAAPAAERTSRADDARLVELEEAVRTLTEAVAVLARGLEDIPTHARDEEGAARAAQEAHRILLAGVGGRR